MSKRISLVNWFVSELINMVDSKNKWTLSPPVGSVVG